MHIVLDSHSRTMSLNYVGTCDNQLRDFFFSINYECDPLPSFAHLVAENPPVTTGGSYSRNDPSLIKSTTLNKT